MATVISNRIAELNDQLRKRVGIPTFGGSVPGKILMTVGIMSLKPEHIIEIWALVRVFDSFSQANDPYGEHDFGAITVAGQKVFWKIDYYGDENCNSGSEDPSDISKSFRVLTIMLAHEY